MPQQKILDKLTTDIRLRGMSEDTAIEYVTKASVFMRHFDKPADQMGETEFRAFLEYLDREKKMPPAQGQGAHRGLTAFSTPPRWGCP